MAIIVEIRSTNTSECLTMHDKQHCITSQYDQARAEASGAC